MRAINSPPNSIQPLSLPPPSHPADGGQHPNRSRRRSRPLGQHINKSLRRKEWTSKNRAWSRTTLDRERRDFFDTRVTGHPEIWQSLRAALQVLWDSDTARLITNDILPNRAPDVDNDDHDPSVALATAQSILDAADITLPTGNLADGAYDSLGNYYQLPSHVVSDPVNIVSDHHADGLLGEATDDLKGAEDTPEDADLDDEGVERRREDKGKSVVDARSQVVAVIRLSDTSRDLKLCVSKEETVRSIIRRIVEETGVSLSQHQHCLSQIPGPDTQFAPFQRRPNCRTHRIRIAHLGKILQDSAPPMAQGWHPGQVLNAFIYDSST